MKRSESALQSRAYLLLATEKSAPVALSFFYPQKVVAHGLVSELVQEWRVEVHRPVGDQEDAPRPRRVRNGLSDDGHTIYQRAAADVIHGGDDL